MAQRRQDPEALATLRLENPADARPSGLPITTVVPFAPGTVREADEVGFDVPGEAEVLERHREGSIRYLRVRVLPTWKASRSTFVELRRGGSRPTPPGGAMPQIPKLHFVLEDLDGRSWIASFAEFRSAERTALRELLRAGGPHRPPELGSAPAESRPGVATEFLACELFVERFPGAPFVVVTAVLRNDPPANPPGAVRFRSYRLEVEDPNVRAAIAWEKENGVDRPLREVGRGEAIELLPAKTKDLWLGDGQTKMWRLVLDTGGDETRAAVVAKILEHPILPGFAPQEWIRSRAWGDLGDLVLGPPPATSKKLATAAWMQARKAREYGWIGPWGDVKDTHQTGSPRNGLSSEGVLRTLATGQREWFDLAWERSQQHALRPILRGVAAADHPEALLWEGLPHPKWKDRMGRESGPDPRFARFREGTSGGWKQETHGWNGFDVEHFTVDDLYALHLFTGDPWIRFELSSVGQALLTHDFGKRPATTRTTRGDGWVLRGLCLLHRALGDPKYLEAARNLVLGMDAERGKGAIRYLHENEPDARHLENHPFEMPWQVAIAIDGLAAYHALTGDELARRIALDLAGFLVKDCWDSRKGSFRESVAVDGSGASRDSTDFGGTQSWIPSGLVAAHRLEPAPEYWILANAVYEKVKTSNAAFEKSGIQWTWWQSFLRELYDRETGRRALPGSVPGRR